MKDKGYVALQQKRLVPTESGQRLCDFLTTHFPDVLAADDTARLEAQLDAIALGRTTRTDVLRNFWQTLQPQLSQAATALLSPPPVKPLLLHPVEE